MLQHSRHQLSARNAKWEQQVVYQEISDLRDQLDFPLKWSFTKTFLRVALVFGQKPKGQCQLIWKHMKLKENPNVVLNTEKSQSISYYWEPPGKRLPRLFRPLQLCADLSVEGNKCCGMVGEIQSALVSAGLTSRRSPQTQRATVRKCLPDRHWSTRFYCDCFSHSARGTQLKEGKWAWVQPLCLWKVCGFKLNCSQWKIVQFQHMARPSI